MLFRSVRPDRLSEEVRRAGEGRGRADVLGAAAITRYEESLAEAFECFFAGPRWHASMRRAVCRTAVTSARSLLDAASSGLGRSREVSNRLRPLPTVSAVRVLCAVARRASSLKRLHVLEERRERVATDRHGRDKSTLRELSAGCQSAFSVVQIGRAHV